MNTPFRAGLVVAGACAAYALVEPHRFRLQTHRLEVEPSAPRLTILHVSDLHLSARDERRARFVRTVAGRLDATPDLVIATGDLIEDDSGIDPAIEALGTLRARLGCFYVLGSHDYYQARFKSPTRYLSRTRGPLAAPAADVERLEAGLAENGWIGLANRTEHVAFDDRSIRIAGVDDPYLGRERTDHIARTVGDAFAIGLTHAPDVISEWSLAGFDLILAGHTHGGQLRMPLVGALVTNSTLPPGLAMGPSKVGSAWLHVSPGLGTSKFTPVRFLCRPEVTLLEIVPTI